MMLLYEYTICITLVIVSINAYNLTILHTNDVHARFDDASKYGGICTDKTGQTCVGGVARRFVY